MLYMIDDMLYMYICIYRCYIDIDRWRYFCIVEPIEMVW